MSRRDIGYRLLGRSFDYLLHTRPAEWPILAVHLLTGSALGLGLDGIFQGAGGRRIALGAIAFVLGLNGGTLALNSAFDRDEGDIAYLRRPPPPPPGLALFGLGLMLGGWAVALLLPRAFLVAYSLCLILSVLYSVPPIRLKAAAGFDWLINMAGFGFLTAYAGWALTARPVTPTGWIILAAFAGLFGALYPLTQLYQLEEDTRRGDRTLAVRLGVTRSLGLAAGMCLGAFAGFALAAGRSGWTAAAAPALRWVGLLLAAGTWCWVLLPWWRRRGSLGPEEHQAGMVRALAAWAVTDAAVLFAWAR